MRLPGTADEARFSLGEIRNWRDAVSWEYSKYETVCEMCGHRGFCVRGSDDWGRSSTKWEGFENRPSSSTAVARKRVDSRDMEPVCICGGTMVKIGDHIEDF